MSEYNPYARPASLGAADRGEAVAASLSLAMVALSRVVEDLTQEVKDLREKRQRDILTAQEAADYLGFRSVVAFEQVARREGIPKHYISERHPRYFRDELREFVRNR